TPICLARAQSNIWRGFYLGMDGPPAPPIVVRRYRLGPLPPCCRFRSLHLAFWLLLSFARDALVHFLAIVTHFRLSAPTRRGLVYCRGGPGLVICTLGPAEAQMTN